MERLFDWGGVQFAGPWTRDEAEAFASRVEEIAIEEAARLAAKAAADCVGAEGLEK